MGEELLHFAYQYRLYDKAVFFNTDHAELMEVGKHNTDAGPDFIGAKLKTKEAVWVGNVEIHVKSSDWNLHKHNTDKAYNNVILHVVQNHNCDVYTENGRLLPVLEIQISDKIKNKYSDFVQHKGAIACEDYIKSVDTFKLKMWLSKVLVQRLHKKVENIKHLLEFNNNDWESVLYQSMARGFGFKINSEPFEKLAKSISRKIISKHKNPFQIESVFMGQAGFLADDNNEDTYYNKLKNEYVFLKNKFDLCALDKHEWKFLRLRPSNFPTIRIAQFANLMVKYDSLFSKVIKAKSVDDLFNIFEIKASEYWDTHYTFGHQSAKRIKIMGTQSVNSILINSLVPFLFAYGKFIDNEEIKDRAISFLDKIKPEKNRIISMWKNMGIKAISSFDTQALIEQKKSYCDDTKCLKCGIGIAILRNNI